MPTNEHIYEAQVIRDTEYLNAIEAAVMQCALEIHQEDPDTPGHSSRAAIALAIFLNPADTSRFARFFAWLAIFNPTIREQVFQPALQDPITPGNIDGEALRTLIKNAWNVAANVGPEPEGSEG